MNKKTLKRQRDLKTKLMAAISMLLVSSLMMITSTYAWFTLSTAPEVTGITTAVGANGNLEMALLNPTLQENKALKPDWGDLIASGTSDSMDAAGQLLSAANITWGNLVDLSDPNTYGLNNITLYPSALATVTDGTDTKVATTPLSRPVYGADGRIAELKADTLTAAYVSGTFSAEGAFGVRAVGTASSMTAREMAHRAALTSAATASTAAKNAASGTLKTNGNVLAGIAISYAGNKDAEFSYTQVDAIRTVVKDLQTAQTNIETAMKWYVVAHNIAPGTVTDTNYLEIQNAINGMSLADISVSTEYARPAGFDDTTVDGTAVPGAYSTLVASQAKVTSALSTLNTLLDAEGATTRNDITWGEFSAALNSIMDYNKMLLCDVPMDDVKEKDEEGNFVNVGQVVSAMNDGGLRLQMRTGSGVFADIADFCGTYSASIKFPEGTKVMGVDLGGWDATMTTDKPKNPTWLNDIRTGTTPFTDGDSANSTKSITDFYGYIVDLAFRTNASDSSLLLQAEGIDRIYGDEGKNEDTMGGGSNMTFTGSDAFGVTKVQALMSNLRIIFFETNTSIIIGEARLNPETADIEGSSVTMKMAMWDTENNAFKSGDEAKIITDLKQNEAKAISILVYLDGNSVKNKDVAATGSQSMVGSMNLQFASSAELVPMEYADLKDGKSDTTQAITMNKVSVDAATEAKGISVARAVGTNGTGFAVILSNAAENSVVTATVNGTAITGESKIVSGVKGYTFAYTEELTSDTEILITVTEGANGGEDQGTPESGEETT